MKLRGCSDSYFIWSIQDCMVKKVHNTDSFGRPKLKFKKLDDIYQHENVEYTQLALAERNTIGNCLAVEEDVEDLTLSQIKKTCKRKRRKASEAVPLTPKEEEDDSDLSEPLFKFRVKGLKSSKSKQKPANGNIPSSELRKDLATASIKVEAPEMDAFECRETTHMADDGPFVCVGSVRFIASETGFVHINPVPECTEPGSEDSIDSFENMEVDNQENTVNGLMPLSVSKEENEVYSVNCLLPLSISEVENEETTVDHLRPFSVSEENEESTVNHLLPLSVSEVKNEENKVNCLMPLSKSEEENEENTVNCLLPLSECVVVNEENMVYDLLPLSVSEVENEESVNQSPSLLSSVKDSFFLEDWTTSTSNCSQSQITPEEVVYISSGQDSDATVDEGSLINQELCSPSNLSFEVWTTGTSNCSQSQQTPEEVVYIFSGQDSDATVDEDSLINLELCSPSLVPDSLSLPRFHSSLNSDDHVDDVVATVAKLPESEEKQHLTLENTVGDSNSVNSGDKVYVPANSDLEVKLDHNYQTDVKNEKTSEITNSCFIETRQPERLPLTRKVISPNSQKLLCQAMESAELLDDIDNYKCKVKLGFEEQTKNKFLSTESGVEDTEPRVYLQQGPQLIQNKVVISSQHVPRRAKHYKKGSPPKKGCLDGPRLCRSLPRLSTGCTSIQGCSESAIAFSQRQMQDIETLASKLMCELDSMKALVEEKLLYGAYRSPSLKNVTDEVKSAIKSATKTEESAKRWLSMMSRDCNRFCKIMKLNEDDDTSTSASADPALGNSIYEKPLQREKKKISFADEAGGMLCDIKVFQMDRDSLEQ